MPVNSDKRDYYEVLGVSREATEQELKTAYRRKALECHPDRNPDRHGAEEQFKELNEAYSVLSDPQKRAAYDRYGHAGVSAAAGAGGFESTGFADFQDIFEAFGFGDLFGMGGGGRRRTHSQRGADLRYDLEISFEEAAFGLDTHIKVPTFVVCGECLGTGAKRGTSPVTCPTCSGRGQMRYSQGFFSISKPCSTCQATGQVIKNPCSNCRGHGRVREEKTLKVKIPSGVDTGTNLRVAGEGEAGRNGGPSGDLFVVIGVKEHPFFEREQDNLFCTIPISFTQATLGADIMAPTLEGEETLHIPEGTPTEHIFRLRGKGIPHLQSSGRGDLFVRVRVRIPTKLNKEQKRLLQQLEEILPADNKPWHRSMLAKVKDYFS